MNALEKKNLAYICEQNKQLCKQLFMIALVENNLDGKIRKTKKTQWDWMLIQSMNRP